MRIVGILLFLSLCCWACSSPQGGKKELSGVDVYKSRCMTCHGTDGRMGMNGAKELPSSQLTIEQRIEVIRNGRKLMPAFGEMMTEEEIKAVAEFTMTMK